MVIIKPLAYNAQANVASERFWRHLTARMMATSDYPGDAGTDARITFEWNIQRKCGTGFSPYVRTHVRCAGSYASSSVTGEHPAVALPYRFRSDRIGLGIDELTARSAVLHRPRRPTDRVDHACEYSFCARDP